MTYVPTELGSLHQCGAVALLTTALALTNLVRASGARSGINRRLIREIEKVIASSSKA